MYVKNYVNIITLSTYSTNGLI